MDAKFQKDFFEYIFAETFNDTIKHSAATADKAINTAFSFDMKIIDTPISFATLARRTIKNIGRNMAAKNIIRAFCTPYFT